MQFEPELLQSFLSSLGDVLDHAGWSCAPRALVYTCDATVRQCYAHATVLDSVGITVCYKQGTCGSC